MQKTTLLLWFHDKKHYLCSQHEYRPWLSHSQTTAHIMPARMKELGMTQKSNVARTYKEEKRYG